MSQIEMAVILQLEISSIMVEHEVMSHCRERLISYAANPSRVLLQDICPNHTHYVILPGSRDEYEMILYPILFRSPGLFRIYLIDALCFS